MVIEAARHLAGIPGASSTEMDPDTTEPVIHTMADQHEFVDGDGDMGGTMRLGAYPAQLVPNSIVAAAYGTTDVSERHRHRYEVNNAYRDRLEQAGLKVAEPLRMAHLLSSSSLIRLCTPTMLQRRRIRSLRAVRRARIRCSRG